MLYKAWIPNVSGTLSFTNIKGASIPHRARSPQTFHEIGDGGFHSILSIQERTLQDQVFASSSEDLLYLLKAEVQNQWEKNEFLKGAVLTIPLAKLEESDRSLVRKKLSSISPEKIKQLIDVHTGNDLGALVEFELFRDGFITMCQEKESLSKLTSHLETKKVTPLALENILYGVVFEAFSFLKDLIHAHKFHRPGDDRILMPHLSDQKDTWIIKTIRNLHKSIVFTYRNATYHRNARYQEDLINALGKLSYLDSFQKVVKLRFEGQLPDWYLIDTSTLKNSLKLKLRFKDQGASKNNANIFYTIVFSALALVFALAQLLQIPCIQGLSTLDGCSLATGPFYFSVSQDVIDTVQFILDRWINILLWVPMTIFGMIVHMNWSKFRHVTNKLFGPTLGGIRRIIYSVAVNKVGGYIMLVLLFVCIYFFLNTALSILGYDLRAILRALLFDILVV